MAAAAAHAPQFYMNEKWKLSKKDHQGSNTTTTTTAATSTSRLIKNASQRRNSFARKCVSLVKEQRARFYIMRRCVTMLICWHEYGDS